MMELTAMFVKVPEGYFACIEEIPGVNTQGATLDEFRQNLREAFQLVLEGNRQLTRDRFRGVDVVQEPFHVA